MLFRFQPIKKRNDLNDQIFRTEKENIMRSRKLLNVVKGQPVLVGTTSIEKSENFRFS